MSDLRVTCVFVHLLTEAPAAAEPELAADAAVWGALKTKKIE